MNDNDNQAGPANEFGPVDLTGVEPDKLPGRSSDRLEEARDMDDMNLTSEQVDIHDWLISELEKHRTKTKEQVEKAWRAGFQKGSGRLDNSDWTKRYTEDDGVYEYMKALTKDGDK